MLPFYADGRTNSDALQSLAYDYILFDKDRLFANVLR